MFTMIHGSFSLSSNSRKLFFLTILALCFVSVTEFGQMTADDIERLRQRGLNEGWTFTVAGNRIFPI